MTPTPCAGGHHLGGPDDPTDEEKATRAVEWQIILSRRDAQLDRRRRAQQAASELAEIEHRARRDAEDARRRASEAAARERFAHARANQRHQPSVDLDLARAQLNDLHIEPL